MDTAGAMLGLLIALGVVCYSQQNSLTLSQTTFRTIVLFSIIPAFLAVITLAFGAKEVKTGEITKLKNFNLRGLGKPFLIFLIIVSIFYLGNSSDAFLVLRAQNLGVSVTGILLMLVMFNLVYSSVSTPAGSLSDRIGRRTLIVGGWLVYAVIYLGFGVAETTWQVWILFVLYGLYYGMAYGTANAMVADLVPEKLRGTAYGTYHATIGLLAFPASLIAGLLWEYVSPAAPFYWGGVLALSAAIILTIWKPQPVH